jgi:hypothetical protein
MPAFQRLMNIAAQTYGNRTDNELDMVPVPSQSGIGTALVRCPVCQTGLWTHYVDGGPHITYLRVGTLDHPWELDPDAHIFTRSRREFITISDGKPQFEEYYVDRELMYRPDAKDRVEALKAKQGEWMGGLRKALNP